MTNLSIIEDFVSENEKTNLIEWASKYQPVEREIENLHIKKINDSIKGFSILNDMTGSDVSKYISKFQGDNTVVELIPDHLHTIKDRIANKLKISKDHVFVQLIVMAAGGVVKAHYDAAMPGYVTYKCNINLKGPDVDCIYVNKEKIHAKPGDLYCFEASLYKHWVDVCDSERILLSYGFILKYDELGRDADDPRIRLSNRIWKAFIGRS